MILNETYTLENGLSIPKLGLAPGSSTTIRPPTLSAPP